MALDFSKAPQQKKRGTGKNTGAPPGCLFLMFLTPVGRPWICIYFICVHGARQNKQMCVYIYIYIYIHISSKTKTRLFKRKTEEINTSARSSGVEIQSTARGVYEEEPVRGVHQLSCQPPGALARRGSAAKTARKGREKNPRSSL